MTSLWRDFEELNDLILKTQKSWNRAFSEKDGYVAVKPKDGSGILFVFNTLGVSKDNLKVTYKKVKNRYDIDRYYTCDENGDGEYYCITVSGATLCDELDKEFSVNYNIYMRLDLEKVQFTTRDGLTFVYVTGQEQSKKENKETEVKASDKITW